MSLARAQAQFDRAYDPMREVIAPTLCRYWSDPAFAAEINTELADKRKAGADAWSAATRRNHPHIEEAVVPAMPTAPATHEPSLKSRPSG